jgi:hypothetical protein
VGLVGGAVVDDDDLELIGRKALLGQTGERPLELFAAVVSRDHDADRR